MRILCSVVKAHPPALGVLVGALDGDQVVGHAVHGVDVIARMVPQDKVRLLLRGDYLAEAETGVDGVGYFGVVVDGEDRAWSLLALDQLHPVRHYSYNIQPP